MKKDILINSLIKFLIPLSLFYGAFLIISCISYGLSSILFGLLLLFIVIVIYEMQINKSDIPTFIFTKSMIWITMLAGAVYLVFSFAFLIGLLG